MLDHVYLPVSDVSRSRVFYRKVLATLGIEEGFAREDSVVFGIGSPGALWIYPVTGRHDVEDDTCGMSPSISGSMPTLHLAFRAVERDQVREFFAVAESAGAETIEEPRLFTTYHPTYFATFVRDPDGHNLEAVCTSPS